MGDQSFRGWGHRLEEGVMELATGSIAIDLFGRDAEPLDFIFLMAEIERIAAGSLAEMVAGVPPDVPWTHIAAALGVTRQAATKRYGR
jgi:hypothetical protein